MESKNLSDLDQLEQDIWLNFCYYYQCDLVDMLIKPHNSLYRDHFEKIIKRMQQNDFPVSEGLTSLLEMMGDAFLIPFKPFQIAQLLMQINTLRFEVEHLSPRMFQRKYSEILIAYVQIIRGLEFIKNHKLARSAKAILAVKARYEKHLYPRREILYRILREQVARHGKWDNLNQAVNFILDDLVKAFEAYDIKWLKAEFAIKQEMLKKLENQSAKKANVELSGVPRKTTASTAKKIEKIQLELKNLNQILKAEYPSKEMEKSVYKMPYSGGYIAETIIHELRNQSEILKEILLNAN